MDSLHTLWERSHQHQRSPQSETTIGPPGYASLHCSHDASHRLRRLRVRKENRNMQTGTSRLREPRSMVGNLADALCDTAPRTFQPDTPADSPTTTRRSSWLERLDNWFWRSELREREAWLAQARDIHDLEQRLAQANNHVGSRFY